MLTPGSCTKMLIQNYPAPAPLQNHLGTLNTPKSHSKPTELTIFGCGRNQSITIFQLPGVVLTCSGGLRPTALNGFSEAQRSLCSEIGSRTPTDTKTWGCSSSLHKMAQYLHMTYTHPSSLNTLNHFQITYNSWWVLSCSVLSDPLGPHALQPIRLLCPCNSPAKNTGVGCHFLLQRIFPTQGSNPGLLHCKQMLLLSEPRGKLKRRKEWI